DVDALPNCFWRSEAAEVFDVVDRPGLGLEADPAQAFGEFLGVGDDREKSCEIFASITIVGHAPSAWHYLRPIRDLRSPGGGRNGLGVPGARPATRSRRRAQSHLRRDRARSVDAIAIRAGSESDRGALASEHRLDFRFLER